MFRLQYEAFSFNKFCSLDLGPCCLNNFQSKAALSDFTCYYHKKNSFAPHVLALTTAFSCVFSLV